MTMALLNRELNRLIAEPQSRPHPKSLSPGRGTLILAPFSPREKGWG